MVPIFQELHTEKPAAARHREGCISAILKLSLTAVPRTQWSTPETWCSRLFHRCIGRVGEGGDAYDVGTIRGSWNFWRDATSGKGWWAAQDSNLRPAD